MENFSSTENGIFSRELQNIRAEVADCENQIAILTAQKATTSQEVSCLQRQLARSLKSIVCIDDKIKVAKVSYTNSNLEIGNAPRQLKFNSNEISSLRLAIDREKYFSSDLDKSEKLLSTEKNSEVLQIHRKNFTKHYSTAALNKERCSLDAAKFQRNRGDTILRILSLYFSQRESVKTLIRLAEFCDGITD